MLFDKNGEVVSYDESDIFCDEFMRADEHIDPSYYINYVGTQSGKSNEVGIQPSEIGTCAVAS